MANEYLTRTPTAVGNRKQFTISFWVKNNLADGNYFQQREDSNSSQQFGIQDRTNDSQIRVIDQNSGSTTGLYDTLALYRDFSSWKHIMVSVDTTISITQSRLKLFVNGVEIRDFDSPNHWDSDYDTSVSTTARILIGAQRPNSSATLNNYATAQLLDYFYVDGKALSPDLFGFYKTGKGYQASGTDQGVDFRPGQWVPKRPSTIKNFINESGGFGVNGFYLPMNDSSNFGADFHCDPNTIITLQDETAPQPKNGAPTTTDSYVSQLRSDPYAANLVLAIPGIAGGQGSGYGDYHADIKGSGSNKTVTAHGNAGIAATASYYGSAMQFDGTGDLFSVPNSSDFDFGDGDFTVEFWTSIVSFGDPGSGIWDGTNDQRSWLIYQNSSALPRFFVSTDGTSAGNISVTATAPTNTTNQWTHLCMERHGPNLFGYVNGACVGVNTELGTQSIFTPVDPLGIGSWGASNMTNGYIQDFRIYKGVAKYKGGFDVSKPFTPVGIATWREVPDTTGNNFATLNRVGSGLRDLDGDGNTSATYSNGNLSVVLDDNGSSARASIGIHTGKWYWETRIDVNSNSCGVGIVGLVTDSTSFNDAEGVCYEPRSDRFRKAGTNYFDGTDNKTDNGLIVGVALDKNVGIISFFADGQPLSSGTTTGINTLSVYHLPECFTHNDGASNTFTLNYGQNPTFCGQVSVSSTQRNADANGKGQFRYAPPSGFLALCEDNLPTPTIEDPGNYFKTVLFEGNGGIQSVKGVGFRPDLVWIKSRTSSHGYAWYDSIRGIERLDTTATQAGRVNEGNIVINSDGFDVTSSHATTNNSGAKMVAWCWQAGAGTTSLNTSGSINSVVSVNQTAGFSIVSYTGNGTSGSIGHGLSKAPQIIICKNRFESSNWSFNGSVAGLIPGINKMILQDTNALISDNNEVTSITDTLFNVGNSGATNGANDDLVAYCWHEVEGFSRIGRYVGDGSTNGQFVFCGFRPAWVMIKQTNDSNNWHIEDSSRKSYNPVNMVLRANIDNTESADNTSFNIDLLSNGFKLRSTNDELNEDGSTYLFMAFAESPFKTANAK